jgi:hypothetical protein
MSYSAPRLHFFVLRLAEHRNRVAFEMTAIADARMRDALSGAILPASAPSIIIPLTTVSLQTNFNAKIHVIYPGSREAAAELTVDSGNTSLIVPSYAAIAKLENFATAYQVLATGLSDPGDVRPISCAARSGFRRRAASIRFPIACSMPAPALMRPAI